MAKNNPDLQWLENLKQKAKGLHAEEKEVIGRIRSGFVNRAIVFMDIVGSTAFKVEHKESPELWILRVRQFSELLASAIQSSNGRVIKFIGDEVMATFENIYNAQNLVGRIPEIEASLLAATGFETRIKVTADFGPVYELTFEGHAAPDPQGSAVDRCARISKFGVPGEVLASDSFAEKTPMLKWIKVGSAELKGLGRQMVFQLARKTADLEPRVEVLKKDYDALTEERGELRTATARLEEQNRQLQQQLKEAGERPNPNAIVVDEAESDTWDQFELAVKELSQLIDGAPGSAHYYARFIFLYYANKGAEEYNSYEGRTFDELIDSDLVVSTEGKYYELNAQHKRNKRVIATLAKVKEALDEHLNVNSQDEADLFDWTLTDPEFWREYVGYNVIR